MAKGIEALVLDDRQTELVTEVYREGLQILGLERAPAVVQELLALSVLRHSRHCADAKTLLEATLTGFFTDPIEPVDYRQESELLAAGRPSG